MFTPGETYQMFDYGQGVIPGGGDPIAIEVPEQKEIQIVETETAQDQGEPAAIPGTGPGISRLIWILAGIVIGKYLLRG